VRWVAAEFYLFNHGYADKGPDDERDINHVLIHNATHDREDFWRRRLGREEEFTEAEDREFMNHAIGPDGLGGVIPLFDRHFSEMQEQVRELFKAWRVKSSRVKELLRIRVSSSSRGLSCLFNLS
jgi:hypothetical protein